MPFSDQIFSIICTSNFGALLLESTQLRCRRPESRGRAAALCIAQKPQAQAPGI